MAWKKTNQEIVYSALMLGIEVKIGGKAYGMSENGDLITSCLTYKRDGEKSLVWLPASFSDTSMTSFYSLCETMTDKERAEIVASTVLNTASMTRGGPR